ncbi:hypothetical protein ACLQ18_15500 [Streptomyces sp. DT193]
MLAERYWSMTLSEMQSSPAASVRGGLAERVRANPLDHPAG